MFKLFIFYYIYCFGYVIFLMYRKKQDRLIKAIIIAFFPIIGFIFVHYLLKETKLQDTYQDKEEHTLKLNYLHQNLDVEWEMNIIPIQDALLLNENKIKRKLLIYSLKENIIKNTKILKKALQNEDSETSHYAAAAIMERKRKLLNSIREMDTVLKENPDDFVVMSSYIETMKQYLQGEFFDEGLHKYNQLLEKLLTSGHAQMNHYVDKINRDLAEKNYEQALYYSKKCIEAYPFEEQAYIMKMKVHYTMQNGLDLQKTIEKLKTQPIHLSKKGLSVIRFWT